MVRRNEKVHCVFTSSPNQADSDANGVGDTCQSCCVGRTGNVNGDPDGTVDIADLTTFIDNLFIGFGTVAECQ